MKKTHVESALQRSAVVRARPDSPTRSALSVPFHSDHATHRLGSALERAGLPTFKGVVSAVCCNANDFKVGDPIVQPVSVLMVDVFDSEQGSTQKSCHNVPMLVDVQPANADQSVAIHAHDTRLSWVSC